MIKAHSNNGTLPVVAAAHLQMGLPVGRYDILDVDVRHEHAHPELAERVRHVVSDLPAREGRGVSPGQLMGTKDPRTVSADWPHIVCCILSGVASVLDKLG